MSTQPSPGSPAAGNAAYAHPSENQLAVADQGLNQPASAETAAAETPWWRTAVTYQIYPRSLRDTSGSGMGDLAGITASLDYIRSLGVDAIWLSPFYPSPQVDAGYDVSDYCDVDPMFGDLEDFDDLVQEAHGLGLRVLIDLVPNHSSDRHPLFQAALGAPPGSASRDLYHFVDHPGEEPPNNWRSVFGGPSWTRVEHEEGDQWYYHLFAPQQPDFNWDNPKVTEFFDGVLRFWLDRGADGFRIDVSDALIKDTTWPDTDSGQPVIPKGESSPVHEVYRRFRQVLDSYEDDRMAILETGAPDDIVSLFLRSDEMHQAFNLRFLKTPWNPVLLAKAIDDSLSAWGDAEGGVTWVIENHDNTRSVTRYGLDQVAVGEYVPEVEEARPLTAEQIKKGEARARAMGLLFLALPGAAYIYQGQELGLPQVTDLPPEVIQDPVFFRSKGKQRGRDGCRVPLPWEGDVPPFGFSPQVADAGAGSADTWLPQPEDWAALTVERQEGDPASMLSWYRELLELRKVEPALGGGDLQWLQRPEGLNSEVMHFRLQPSRGRPLEVLINFGESEVPLPPDRDLLASSDPTQATSGVAGPDTAVLLAP